MSSSNLCKMAIPTDILVIRLSSLGDVLLTMPAVQAIKRANPRTSLAWLVEGSVAGLLRHQPFVDRVIEFPRGRVEGALKRGRPISAGRALRAFLRDLRQRRFDLVMDFHGILKSALLSRAARAARRIGFDRTFAKELSWLAYDEKAGGTDKRLHKVRRNLLLASSLGIGEAPDLSVETSPESDEYVDRFLASAGITGPLFAVNPFCSKGSSFKRWDLARYGAVMRRIGEGTGARMMVLWGPGEEEEARQLTRMGGDQAILACPTTVTQLLSLLKRTDLYIGGDTGVMHLAAFAGVPVVAIFGPTDHLVNGPFGDGHTIIRKELPCSPCRDKGCKSLECLREISVDDVCKAVISARAAGRGG